MRVRPFEAAKQDLIAIGDFIGRDSPRRALSFIKEITEKCAGLGDMPLSFPVVPRFERKGIRRRLDGNYQILYRIDVDVINVIRVLHGARDDREHL